MLTCDSSLKLQPELELNVVMEEEIRKFQQFMSVCICSTFSEESLCTCGSCQYLNNCAVELFDKRILSVAKMLKYDSTYVPLLYLIFVFGFVCFFTFDYICHDTGTNIFMCYI